VTVELEVIPTNERSFSWTEVCLEMNSYTQDKIPLSVKNVELVDVATGRLVEKDELLTPPHYYGIDLAGKKSLEIDFTKNVDSETDEMMFLDDFATQRFNGNLAELASAWKKIGYSCIISTHPRRHADEPYFVIVLAIAIARLCDGAIVVKSNNSFSKPVGIYSPAEFSDVSPLFSGVSET